jgi:5'-nucleotidase
MIKKILLDIDGVLRDYMGYVYQLYAKHYPTHKVTPVSKWNMEEFFPLGKDIYRFVFEEHVEEITANALPIPGELEVLQKYIDRYEFALVSAQNEKGVYGTLEWLSRHRVLVREFHFTFAKETIAGDVLLDDAPHNLEAFAASGRMAVARAQPWNDDWQGHKAQTLEDFFELIETTNNNHK